MEDLTVVGIVFIPLSMTKKSYTVLRKSTSFGTWSPHLVLFLALSFLWLMTLSKLLHFNKPQFPLQWGEWVLICWTVSGELGGG